MGLNLNWLGLGDLLELGIESQKQRGRGANPLTGGGNPTGERTALSKVAAGSHEEQHGNREHKIHTRGQ